MRRNRMHLRTTRENFGEPLPEEEEEDMNVTSAAQPADEPVAIAPDAVAPMTSPVSGVPVLQRSARERRPTLFYQAGQ